MRRLLKFDKGSKIYLKLLSIVKLGDKEQIGVKEPFPMTNRQFTA